MGKYLGKKREGNENQNIRETFEQIKHAYHVKHTACQSVNSSLSLGFVLLNFGEKSRTIVIRNRDKGIRIWLGISNKHDAAGRVSANSGIQQGQVLCVECVHVLVSSLQFYGQDHQAVFDYGPTGNKLKYQYGLLATSAVYS